MKYKQSQYNVVVQQDDKAVIMYNTYSGGLSKLTADTYHNLSSPEKSPYLSALLEQGHIVAQPIDEFERWQSGRKSYIFGASELQHFVIAPTLKCNLRCLYCFENDKVDKPSMTDDIMKNVISFIQKNIDNNPSVKRLRINWFGGEPLLEIERIKSLSQELISYCTKRGIEYSAFMITNGVLLDKKNISELKHVCKIDRLQITLDGDDCFYSYYKGTHKETFVKLINNIASASKFFKISLRMNASQENRETILGVSKAIMNNEQISDAVSIYPAQITDCNVSRCHSLTDCEFEEFRQKFESILKPLRSTNGSLKLTRRFAYCSSMRKYNCVIGPDGNLYRCEYELGNPAEIIGDVVAGFYCNKADKKLLEMDFDAKCKECDILPICAGGCPTMVVNYHKKVDCESMHRRVIQKIKSEILLGL